ncbi:hypothetical protein AB0F72_09285 [Actinoplanes sp. NPDC023936]|uniref:hypothetical protein n=1 Tax=Actinoplanes sp. NPDC023936 TaxID=3154910 RepID=UPI0033DABFD1
MTITQLPNIEPGDLVTLDGRPGEFPVVGVSHGGECVAVTTGDPHECRCGCGTWVDAYTVTSVRKASEET